MMSILYSAANAVSSGSWFSAFKVLMVNVIILTMLSHLCMFGFGYFTDFLNTGTRTLTLAEHASCLPVWRVMQIVCMVWIKVMVIFWWLYFYFLITQHYPYSGVAAVSWLNYLILAIDLWGSSTQYLVQCTIDPPLDSSALLHIHYACIPLFPLLYTFVAHIIFSFLRDCYPRTSQGRITVKV